MRIVEGLTYDDVTLKPRFSEISNRDEKNVSLLCGLGPVSMKLPIVSSPMDTVTEEEMISAMRLHGGLGIVHRFNTIEEQVGIVKRSGAVAAAIGMTGNFVERAHALVDVGVGILCVDTAHGHCDAMRSCLSKLRNVFGNDIHVMAGSIATEEAAIDLCRWGADSLRVGIGGGSICSTRLQTGFGVPNLTALLETVRGVAYARQYHNVSKNIKIIADGGIRKSGDMIKALAAGADLVMLGSMLAGTNEAPGELLKTQDGPKKVYRGMASREAQHDWRGSASAPEGVSAMIPYKGPVSQVLDPIPGWLRSGFSYNGARNVHQLRQNAEFYKQSNAGVVEGHTHIDYVK